MFGETRLEEIVTGGLIAYILGVFIISVYVSIRSPTGMLRMPPLRSLISSFYGLFVSNLQWGALVLVTASALRKYSENLNWLVSGIGIGLILHFLTVSVWKIQGASGPEIATYSVLLGTGLKLPVSLGITGQLTQKLALGSKTASLIERNLSL